MIDGRAQRAALERELIARRGFAEFVRRAWHVIEPSQVLIWNWHVDEMCAHAEALVPRTKDAAGNWDAPDFLSLVVNIPPRHMKTQIWCVLWPAYVWTYRPEYRWIFVTYTEKVMRDAATKHYELVNSPWYRERWGNILKARSGKHAIGDFWTAAGGRRFSTIIGGAATGIHGHAFVIDDPVKAAAGDSASSDLSAQLTHANAYLASTAASRSMDPKSFVRVMVMQRIHENDPSQVAIDNGAVSLRLPAKYDASKPCKTPVGGDRRTYDGELLWPEYYGEAELNTMAKEMLGWDGPIACAQLQQEPAPKGGLIFRASTFQPFDLKDEPIDRTHSVLSIDCNFKKADVNSDVGIVIGGIRNKRMYIYEARSLNIGFKETLDIAAQLVRTWRPTAIIIEDKANGPALIDLMKDKFNNVLPIDPKTTKEARAHGANVFYQSGSVYHCNQMLGFPSKATDPPGGKAGFEQALSVFPRGRKKDVVDALTQLIWYLHQQDYSNLLGALDALEKEQGTIRNAFDGMFRLS